MIRKSEQFRTFIALFLLNMAIFCSIYIAFPAYRPILGGEDGFVETLSAITFLASFLYGIATFAARSAIVYPKLLGLLSLIGLVGFLDEMSFGERLFGLSMPSIGDNKLDAVHDIFTLSYQLYGNVFLVIIFGVLITVVVLAWLHRTYINANLHRLVPSQQACMLLGVFAMLLTAAILIDLDFLAHGFGFYFLEELLELNAALSLFLCCRSVVAIRPERVTHGRLPASDWQGLR